MRGCSPILHGFGGSQWRESLEARSRQRVTAWRLYVNPIDVLVPLTKNSERPSNLMRAGFISVTRCLPADAKLNLRKGSRLRFSSFLRATGVAPSRTDTALSVSSGRKVVVLRRSRHEW